MSCQAGQNRLVSNSHCSTYYNKLLYVWGEGYFELLVNFADFLFIVHAIFSIPSTSIARMRERRPDSVKYLSLNHDHQLVVKLVEQK